MIFKVTTRDPQGAPIAGIDLQATNVIRGRCYKRSSDGSGYSDMALGTDRAVYYVSQVAANTNTWGAWKCIGGVALDFTVGTHGNGALEIFEIGTDHRLADPEPLDAMLKACGDERLFRLWRATEHE